MGSEFPVSSFQFQTTTHSAEETQNLGQRIGEHIQAGTVLALYGDLGSGKTVFVQGLGMGLNVPEDYTITSPTYTLINEYPGRIKLFHVDLYRIANPVEMEDTGLDDVFRNDASAAIEWADRLGEDLPENHIKIQFKINGTESRKIKFSAYGQSGVNLLKTVVKDRPCSGDP
ncbi:MAG TPA: tRNA (adenosine(37)-N6)-threonylcarbamoyltransferase complex ATPase subunit type 1 TsaE [Deltaproteobacteria bacterium]|nr:tRNA (adenosine(37)-N6)-threonylcarbamoyltransferase complex ATPase subunit type 1 TsaE [Deltaproteobacteria bacterium]